MVGGTGYTGVELLRLLARHPFVQVDHITSRGEVGKSVSSLFPNLRGIYDEPFSEPDAEKLAESDVVFFATPNGTAMRYAPQLLQKGCRVIDLAADFRLTDVESWQQWYGMQHACAELVPEAVYGLPEINREKIAGARLVANPGCYPTSSILGLLPLLQAGLVVTDGLVIDGKSGVSGAGRGASVAGLMSENGESFKAYAIPGHRHQPEICQLLSQISGHPVSLVFVPHLLPMIRGIEATLYARLKDHSEQDLQALFEQHYADEPFVDVMPAGSHPETRSVRGVNHCRIAVHRPLDGDFVVVSSVIDNLVKGAAGQAVQNMNIMFALDETAGLQQVALLP